MVHFVFFCSSMTTPISLLLLCSTCWTFLFIIFWAINQELLFMYILRKFAKLKKKKKKKKESWCSFFGKVVCLQHPNLLKGSPTISVFLGITYIIFCGIFRHSCYIESMQIIDTFIRVLLLIYLKMAYWLTYSYNLTYQKRKDLSSSLHFLSPWLSYALCVNLTFIAQYSNILHPS